MHLRASATLASYLAEDDQGPSTRCKMLQERFEKRPVGSAMLSDKTGFGRN